MLWGEGISIILRSPYFDFQVKTHQESNSQPFKIMLEKRCFGTSQFYVLDSADLLLFDHDVPHFQVIL